MEQVRVNREILQEELSEAVRRFRELCETGADEPDAWTESIRETLERIAGRKETGSSLFDVYAVEIRQYAQGGAQGAGSAYSSEVVYLASSEEKALEWCRRNTEFAFHHPDKPWNFAIRRRSVDTELMGGGLVLVVDWDGEVTGWAV